MACKSSPDTSANEPASELAPEQPRAANTVHHDIDVELPCIDAMLMGTLALMTGYAEHQCEQGNPRCRDLMAKKIGSNLFFLASHPRLSAPMAAVMGNLQRHWHTLSARTSLESSAAASSGCADAPLPAQERQATRLDSPAQPQAFWLPEHSRVQ